MFSLLRAPDPPAGLLYPDQAYILITATSSSIEPVSSFYAGYTHGSCSVVPTLPSGLHLNSSTCVVHGHPRVATLPANYTIFANNSVGASWTTIQLTVWGKSLTAVTGC